MVAGSSEVQMCRLCNEPMANSQDYAVAGHICGEQHREGMREAKLKGGQFKGPPIFKALEEPRFVVNEETLEEGLKGPLLGNMGTGHIEIMQAPIYPQGMNKEQWLNEVALRVLEGRYAGSHVKMGSSYAEVAKMSYDQADFFLAEGEKRMGVVE